LTNLSVREITVDGSRLLLSCRNGDSREENQLDADYVVFATGREPCLDFLGAKLRRSLKDLTKSGKLHLIGDVKNEIYRQTAICVGDGVKAAMRICRTVKEEDA
jgi:thioredoxin reductase (NADPH)